MDDVPIPNPQDQSANQFLAAYSGPAYIRRARQVELLHEDLLERCRRQRDEWLEIARMRFAVVCALDPQRRFLSPNLVAQMDRVRAFLGKEAKLRVPVSPATSSHSVTSALNRVLKSLNYFNRRWSQFLHSLDLTAINEARDGYNRYYVFEKECAVGNSRIARHGFQPLAPLTREELLTEFPLFTAS